MKARDNPFATWRVEQLRFRLDGLNWEELFERFNRLGRRAALVGSHGSGKTTLMEEFGQRFRQQGLRVHPFRLTQDERDLGAILESVPSGLGPSDVVLLDGAEQLSAWDWRWFLRFTARTGGLLVTTHRSGRLPALYRCQTNPELLASLVEELAAGFAWPGIHGPVELLQKHRGNLRDALRELYDWFATRPA